MADDIHRVVGTGYGRLTLEFVDKAVTEITCHARGVSFVVPGSQMVIDVGGQDSKAILLDASGRVRNFVMNDKCAAGTGRFLQVTLNSLGLEVSDLPDRLETEPVSLGSTCTVFAESEVVGMLAKEVPLDCIVAGLFKSIAERITVLAGRLGECERVSFTGGLAQISAMRQALTRALGVQPIVPDLPQLTGALGAALIAQTL